MNTDVTVSRVALNPFVCSGDGTWGLDAHDTLSPLGAFWLLGKWHVAETPHTQSVPDPERAPGRALPLEPPLPTPTPSSDLASGGGLNYFPERHKNSFWIKESFLNEMKMDFLWHLVSGFGSLAGDGGMFVFPSGFRGHLGIF